MAIRNLKILLVLGVGAMALLYAIQNVVNWGAAMAVVDAVLSMEGHEYYPAHIGPPVTAGPLVLLALLTILAGEFLAGALSVFGALKLWAARKKSAAEFDAAKGLAAIGLGFGLAVWFGMFSVFGGAYFQMWQTELGAQSLNGAFMYVVMIGLILIFLNQAEREL